MTGSLRSARRALRYAPAAAVVLLVALGGLEMWLRLATKRGAAPTLSGLFTPDDAIGYRLKPGARLVFRTDQFTTDVVINDQGVRDEPIGPKPDHEFRIVVIGDSMVLSIQSPVQETFCRLLQLRLNGTAPVGRRYRVINAGVQGYGPVEEYLFFKRYAAAFQPDLLLVVTFVGNDAVEAADARRLLGPAASAVAEAREDLTQWRRRLTRQSAALSFMRQKLQDDFHLGPPLPLRQRAIDAYLAQVPADVQPGFDVARQCIEGMAADARAGGAATAVALIPARFQLDDQDFGYLAEEVRTTTGATVVRDAGTTRFTELLTPTGLPLLDLLPVLRAQPDPATLFFRQNVHLTRRGHEVVADALAGFLKDRHLVD